MEFEYLAQDKNGKRINAQVNAESIAVIVSRLKNQGFLPLEIKQVRAARFGIEKLKFIRPKFKTKELAIFSRQLSSSLNAGILLDEALETISEDWEHLQFRLIIEKLIKYIREGESFSAALAKFPSVFSPIFFALVKAGEESGSLDKTLANLAKYLEDADRAVQKLKTSIRYPAFVFGFFIFAVSIIVFFIIPKFKAMFFRAGLQLPLFTRIVVDTSEFILKNILWFLIALVIFVFSFRYLLKYPKFRFKVDYLKFKIPVLGKLIQKTLISRFARTLSILISGGVGLSTSLMISSEISDNTYFRIIIDGLKERVISGFSLSSEMNNQKLFQKMFVKMIQVGEKTGKISEMFQRNADYYDEELETAIANFTSLLEPVLIILIGAVVLIVVLALYLPIFKMAMIRR
jgi:type II secretory pathway component PulF